MLSCCSLVVLENVKEIQFGLIKTFKTIIVRPRQAGLWSVQDLNGMHMDSLCTALTQSYGNILQIAPPLTESCPSLELDDVMRAECWHQTNHRREKIWLPAVTAFFKTAVDHGTCCSAVALSFPSSFSAPLGNSSCLPYSSDGFILKETGHDFLLTKETSQAYSHFVIIKKKILRFSVQCTVTENDRHF